MKKNSIESFSEEDRVLLKLRYGRSDVVDICKHHEMKYLQKYTHLFGNICCNPIRIHKSPTVKATNVILMDLVKTVPSLNLVPGKKNCAKCYNHIIVNPESDSVE